MHFLVIWTINWPWLCNISLNFVIAERLSHLVWMHYVGGTVYTTVCGQVIGTPQILEISLSTQSQKDTRLIHGNSVSLFPYYFFSKKNPTDQNSKAGCSMLQEMNWVEEVSTQELVLNNMQKIWLSLELFLRSYMKIQTRNRC